MANTAGLRQTVMWTEDTHWRAGGAERSCEQRSLQECGREKKSVLHTLYTFQQVFCFLLIFKPHQPPSPSSCLSQEIATGERLNTAVRERGGKSGTAVLLTAHYCPGDMLSKFYHFNCQRTKERRDEPTTGNVRGPVSGMGKTVYDSTAHFMARSTL